MWNQINHYTLRWQRFSATALPSWHWDTEGPNFLQEIETQHRSASLWAPQCQTHGFFKTKAESQDPNFRYFSEGFSLYYKKGMSWACVGEKNYYFFREKKVNTLEVEMLKRLCD